MHDDDDEILTVECKLIGSSSEDDDSCPLYINLQNDYTRFKDESERLEATGALADDRRADLVEAQSKILATMESINEHCDVDDEDDDNFLSGIPKECWCDDIEKVSSRQINTMT